MMKRNFYAASLGMLSFTLLASAYAATAAENDAMAIAGAKIGLAQAVSAAEQHVGGKAAKAEYEKHGGRWQFDIEVVKDKKVMDVTVDPLTGAVIAATEDRTDHDDEQDKAD